MSFPCKIVICNCLSPLSSELYQEETLQFQTLLRYRYHRAAPGLGFSWRQGAHHEAQNPAELLGRCNR